MHKNKVPKINECAFTHSTTILDREIHFSHLSRLYKFQVLSTLVAIIIFQLCFGWGTLVCAYALGELFILLTDYMNIHLGWHASYIVEI